MDDVLAITQNVAKFAFRDQGRWDELRDLFHPDASMAVTWYSGPIEGFIERSAQMAAAGKPVTSKHWIGASRVTIQGKRALSDTDVAIFIRAKLARPHRNRHNQLSTLFRPVREARRWHLAHRKPDGDL